MVWIRHPCIDILRHFSQLTLIFLTMQQGDIIWWLSFTLIFFGTVWSNFLVCDVTPPPVRDNFRFEVNCRTRWYKILLITLVQLTLTLLTIWTRWYNSWSCSVLDWHNCNFQWGSETGLVWTEFGSDLGWPKIWPFWLDRLTLHFCVVAQYLVTRHFLL